ncbi:TGB-2 [Rubus canadensis virus 1]|uniref:Movement protein TGB2 n=1 Tax=Rubus canadensis virus 1 TaxID=1243178 RepID=K4N435_9VIRU|nr:TGB-2 [Rubus canadensis virus 1]AFV31419.1 TGB-2 [Rubus canadensis virus 1]
MPLTPPKDYTGAAISVVIGLCIAFAFHSLTRSNLPHAGDNIHHLPHGGFYKDGTKVVAYGGPQSRFPSSNLFSSSFSSLSVLCVILLLSGLIYASNKFGGGGAGQCVCGSRAHNNR